MDNLENMKTMWLELNQKVKLLEEENQKLAREIKSNKYKTAKDKLLRKYSMFICIELIMLIYIYIMMLYNPLVVSQYKWPTLIYWTAFFLIEASIDFYLRNKISEIDIYNSPIKQITLQAAKNWKIHKLAIAIGIPFAIGAIILLALSLNADRFMIYGMFVGAIVGFFIGLRQLLQFKTYYNIFGFDE